MNVVSFPNCCTGLVMYDMTYGKYSFSTNSYIVDEEQVQNVKNEILQLANINSRLAFLSCTTIKQQVGANAALKSLGAQHSPWMTKKQHEDTLVRIWWIHIPTLLEKEKAGEI